MTGEGGPASRDHGGGQGVPELVERAQALASGQAFAASCTPATGRLLRVLARRSRRAGEIGTGYGVGAAWILTGLPPGGSLVTIELDGDRAVAVRDLFRDQPAVRVRHGDWRELLDEPPFDLLFADGGRAAEHGEDVLRAVAPGGLVVLDDLTPDGPQDNPVRGFWLGHPGLASVQLQTEPGHAVIVAARLP